MVDNFGFGLWYERIKLDLDALQFADEREAEIAKVIAEETEAERGRLAEHFQSLPPEEKVATAVPDGLLLGSFNDSTKPRDPSASVPWDSLLIGGQVLHTCADRCRVDPVAILKFARMKLMPNNWSAMYWYEQWFVLLTQKLERQFDRPDAAIRDAQEDAAREAAKEFGRAGADKKWLPYREAARFVQEQWAAQKEAYKGNKSEFARSMVPIVKQKFETIDSVTQRTITEQWLKGM